VGLKYNTMEELKEQILALKKENEALKAEIKVLKEKSYSQNKFSEKHVNELVKQIEFGMAKQK
jgi:regulator of replication initiation timing